IEPTPFGVSKGEAVPGEEADGYEGLKRRAFRQQGRILFLQILKRKEQKVDETEKMVEKSGVRYAHGGHVVYIGNFSHDGYGGGWFTERRPGGVCIVSSENGRS